ncbi:uncharacterized protein LOC135200116 [Macrobrachium nipponense]|uniref:uncharacterized protein LOC135200116 n=1 Tax=Macrobrachium nipponense TaxID=159736 RepID=UPI0030C7E45E
MINRNLLDVARQLSSKETEKSFLGVTNDFRQNFRENAIKVVLADCQDAVHEILDATEILKGMKESILDITREAERRMQMMQEVKQSGESISSNIDQNIDTMNRRLDVLLHFEENMRDTDAKLESATDFTSAGIMMDATEEVLNEVRSLVTDIRGYLLENKKETQDIQKAILDTDARLARLPVEDRDTEEEAIINITI